MHCSYVIHDFFFSFQFELLFCLQDESDPALMVVKALMEKYPKVDAKIFIGKNWFRYSYYM